MFDHKVYSKKFLAAPGQNDAVGYDVAVQKVTGAQYHCIGVHHLLPSENVGNHHAFLDVLDERGNRLHTATVGWTWEGRKPNEAAPPIPMDKPDNEPGGNIGMYWAQTVSVWVEGATSDRVSGLHTRHADEKEDWMSFAGNTMGHHSFLVVFQRGTPAPPPPVPVPDQQRIKQLENAIQVAASVLETVIVNLRNAER